MDSYINDIRAARLIAGDFLSANPGQNIAVVAQGEIRLVCDRSGNEQVVTSDQPCATCEHDMAACEDAGACQITRSELK